jgi:outer membrane protein assembly factor BamB
VMWEERTTGPISASLLYAGGNIYLQDEAGLGVVVKPGRTHRIIAKNDLRERSLATPAVIGNDLLIRTQSHLYRFGNR